MTIGSTTSSGDDYDSTIRRREAEAEDAENIGASSSGSVQSLNTDIIDDCNSVSECAMTISSYYATDFAQYAGALSTSSSSFNSTLAKLLALLDEATSDVNSSQDLINDQTYVTNQITSNTETMTADNESINDIVNQIRDLEAQISEAQTRSDTAVGLIIAGAFLCLIGVGVSMLLAGTAIFAIAAVAITSGVASAQDQASATQMALSVVTSLQVYCDAQEKIQTAEASKKTLLSDLQDLQDDIEDRANKNTTYSAEMLSISLKLSDMKSKLIADIEALLAALSGATSDSGAPPAEMSLSAMDSANNIQDQLEESGNDELADSFNTALQNFYTAKANLENAALETGEVPYSAIQDLNQATDDLTSVTDEITSEASADTDTSGEED